MDLGVKLIQSLQGVWKLGFATVSSEYKFPTSKLLDPLLSYETVELPNELELNS